MQPANKSQRPTGRLKRSGSQIRYYSAFTLSGINIIRVQGWRIFWRKFRNKTRRWLRRRTKPDLLYRRWIAHNEPLPEALEKQRQESISFKFRPKISLITPVWNPEAKYLRLAVDSVINQTYDNWELCLADGGSGSPEIRQILQEYAAKDSRIKVKFLAENKGISANSNEALSLATGRFFGLLDHDDELAPFALYEVVKALNDDNSLDFLYSDEDKIDLQQNRSQPFFKPDWSPDMLLSIMYTCHFSVYRKSLIDILGGFKPEYDGSQDYDLALRVMEKTVRIYHITKILYHWRMSPVSAAAAVNNKNYAYEAAMKALTDYLARNKIRGEVLEGSWKGSYRIQREIPGSPLVSIIMPAKDKVDMTRRCLESIRKMTGYPNYEVLLVDNNSTRTEELVSYYQEIAKHPGTRILEYNRPFNFAALNNFAVSEAKGEHLLFLNNDMEVISGEWLSAMLEHSQRKEVGAVGAKLLYPDGSIQHCGVIIGPGGFAGHVCIRNPDSPGYFGRIDIINNYSAVTAACVMVRREVFEDINGFDENLAVAYNDIDLCLRMRAKGYLVVYTPYAKLYHLESFTRGYTLTRKKLAVRSKEYQYVVERWKDFIKKGDPYYNPNLSLTDPDFSLNMDSPQLYH